jgi:hypothetical protein
MSRLAFATILVGLALLPALVLAQTPGPPTQTPEPSVPTAGPDEIVFTGEISAPPGTTVTAAFYAITTAKVDDIICAADSTTPVDDPRLSAFSLRVDVDCAEGRALRHFCWGEGYCYVYLADPPRCSPWECVWSETVHPGATVDFGLLPAAGPNEIIFTGEVPAPPGATVTVQFADIVTLDIATCDTATSTPTDDPTVSAFLLTATVECAVIGLPPKFCWGDDLCSLYKEEDPRITNLAGGTTIALGLLTLPQRSTVPLAPPHGDRGPDVVLPLTGGRQRLHDGTRSAWLLWSGVTLLAVGLAVGGVGLALRPLRRLPGGL